MAREAARKIIRFCRGRAWIFTDTGTTATGESLYQFTHRTFLEYFAALYVVATNPTPKKLVSFFSPKIARGEWIPVAELAIQVQSRAVEGSADVLVQGLVLKARKSHDNITARVNLLSAAVESLEFLTPTTAQTRDLSSTCYELVFDQVSSGSGKIASVGDEPDDPLGDSARRLLHGLVRVADENIESVQTALLTAVGDAVSRSDRDLVGVCEAALAPLLGVWWEERHLFTESKMSKWNRFPGQVLKRYGNTLKDLAEQNLKLHELLYCVSQNANDLVGAAARASDLFAAYNYVLHPNVWEMSASETVLNEVMSLVSKEPSASTKATPDLWRKLAEMRPFLTRDQLPWVMLDTVSSWRPDLLASWEPDDDMRDESARGPIEPIELLGLDSAAVSALVLILACHVEMEIGSSQEKERRFKVLRLASSPLARLDIFPIAVARYDRKRREKVVEVLAESNIDNQAERLLLDWMDHRVDFCQHVDGRIPSAESV